MQVFAERELLTAKMTRERADPDLLTANTDLF